MAISLPGLDKLPEGPLRDFVSALHEIYELAGQPAARVIAKATNELPPFAYQSVSHETVSAALRASTVPAWEKIKSILRVLDDMGPFDSDSHALEQRMIERWRQARRSVQETEQASETDLPVVIVPPPVRSGPEITGPATVEDTPPPAGKRPPAAPGFTGREALLGRMRAALTGSADVRLVLHGPIGAGKTQAVLSYLDRHATGPVWWVPAETAEAAQSSLIELAAVLGVERHQRVGRTVRRVLELLEARHFPYLMIFDGLAGPDELSLVPNGGRVVITTRDPALGRDGSSTGLEVRDLEPGEAEQVLRQHDSGATADQLETVTGTYGRSPLALRQVVAWCRATGTALGSPGGADPADRLHTGVPDGYGRSASLAHLFTFDRLEAVSRPAAILLDTLACFDQLPISKRLLGGADVAQTDPAFAEALASEVALNKAIVDLCRHGLARLADDGRHVELLPLARLVALRAMSGEDAARARARAHALLAAADPGWPDDQTDAEPYWEIAAHVEATALVEARGLRERMVVYHQIRFRYLVGDHVVACGLGERAFATWRVGNDPSKDDHLVLRTSQQWANALRAVGRYEQARELTGNAMSQLRVDPAYGENHAHTLAMAGSRAADLRISGEYRRALEFDSETLKSCRARFTDADPRTIMSRHNRAVSLRLSGDFLAAEREDRTALGWHRQTFGDGNWRTLLSIHALAEDLYGQGRYEDVLDEVEPLVAGAETRRRTRMERGLMLAGRTTALARRGRGQLADALELLEAAHAECRELFGEQHEYTLAARMSHANTLHLLGRTAEAVTEQSLVYDSYRTMFGSRNPLTVAAEINLANMLRARGEHARALNIDRVSSEVLLDAVGRDHPFSVAAAVNLASDYAQDGHPHRLAASGRAYDAAWRVYRPRQDHPVVIAAEANLAVDLAAAGNPTAATRRQEVLQRMHDRYGHDHPIAGVIARGERVDCVLEPPLP